MGPGELFYLAGEAIRFLKNISILPIQFFDYPRTLLIAGVHTSLH